MYQGVKIVGFFETLSSVDDTLCFACYKIKVLCNVFTDLHLSLSGTNVFGYSSMGKTTSVMAKTACRRTNMADVILSWC